MHFTIWLDHYGYIVLFVGLMLELIIFGIPTEVLMSYAGYLVFEGKLNFILSILAAGLGSCVGITASYFIGRKLGLPFFHKYGHKIHMGPERFDHFSHWFSRFGNGLIVVAYFIPGIRHITGYFSGITNLSLRKFMPFAYIGAFLWVSAFISLGRILGPQYDTFHNQMKKYLIIGGIALLCLIILYFLYKRLRLRILEGIKNIVTKSPNKAKLSILVSTVIFLSLCAWLIGLIQDFIDKDYSQFNQLTIYVIQRMFGASAHTWMSYFSAFSSLYVLMVISIITLLWMSLYGKYRTIEIIFFFIVVGGIFIEKWVSYLFGNLNIGFVNERVTSFLSEQSLLSLTIWGYFAFITSRYSNGFFIPFFSIAFVLAITIFQSISQIYLGIHTPSTVGVGIVVAGIWLSLNMMLLGIFRELESIGKINT